MLNMYNKIWGKSISKSKLENKEIGSPKIIRHHLLVVLGSPNLQKGC